MRLLLGITIGLWGWWQWAIITGLGPEALGVILLAMYWLGGEVEGYDWAGETKRDWAYWAFWFAAMFGGSFAVWYLKRWVFV